MKAGRMAWKTIQILAALAALGAIVLWMSGAFRSRIERGVPPSSRPVVPATAARAIVVEDVSPVIEEASGSVQAREKTVISARIMAAIREVRVRPGNEVKKGEILVALDDRDLAARVEEARKAVDATQAARDKTQSDFKRSQELLSQGVIGRSEFDQADSAFKIANANLDAARKGLEAAEVARTHSEIASPVDGRIIERFGDPGDTATPGSPLLSIYDPGSLRFEAPVRESLAVGLHVGDKLRVRIGDARETIDGTIGEIVPQAEAGSRTFLVRVDLPKQTGTYTGMFGRAFISAGERKRLLVPAGAVERIGQLAFVTVIEADGAASRRLVTLGLPADGDRIEALSGLRAGETTLMEPGNWMAKDSR